MEGEEQDPNRMTFSIRIPAIRSQFHLSCLSFTLFQSHLISSHLCNLPDKVCISNMSNLSHSIISLSLTHIHIIHISLTHTHHIIHIITHTFIWRYHFCTIVTLLSAKMTFGSPHKLIKIPFQSFNVFLQLLMPSFHWLQYVRFGFQNFLQSIWRHCRG